MKRINPRRAKLHRSYTAFELAELLDVHKNTVRQWIKAGLPVVDGARPALICGGDFQSWWGKQRKAAKRPCQPGQMYCFKCREPKSPALGMVEFAATNAITGNLKALLRDVRHDDAPALAAGRHNRQNARTGRAPHGGIFKHSCVAASFPKL